MQVQRLAVVLVCGLVLSAAIIGLAQTQQFSERNRDEAQYMLKAVVEDIHKHYYDPKFHGVDLDKQSTEAKQYIAKTTSMNMALGSIATVVDTLNDSHTFFVPPAHATRHEYGWRYEMVGDRCFVTQVQPKSDADLKGLKPGDQVLAINGVTPTRDNTWKLQYLYDVLRPQSGLTLTLQDPQGKQRSLTGATHFGETKRVTDLTGSGGASDIWQLLREEERYDRMQRVRYVEHGDALIIVKLPEFTLSPADVNDVLARVRKHNALILDLRGNPGGAVETLRYFLGGFFEKEIKIADRVGRKENKPQMTKANHNPFTGKLVVLVDSRSASAAELFARVIQLQKRGVVVGDHSSGSVMESRDYTEQSGMDVVLLFGVSITDADLIMEDGKSLEHVGVTPDEVVLPTAADLAVGRDPAMAHAAELVGQKMSPEDAGKLFPFEWPPE